MGEKKKKNNNKKKSSKPSGNSAMVARIKKNVFKCFSFWC